MKRPSEETLFVIGMWWRISYGLLRVVIGLIFLQHIHAPFQVVIDALLRHEIIEDPTDTLRILLDTFFTHYGFVVTYFLAFHFIFWGIMDIILSWSMLKQKLWAFPLSLILMGMFMVYEIFRYTHTHATSLLVLLCIDAVISVFIYREYQRLKLQASQKANRSLDIK